MMKVRMRARVQCGQHAPLAQRGQHLVCLSPAWALAVLMAWVERLHFVFGVTAMRTQPQTR